MIIKKKEIANNLLFKKKKIEFRINDKKKRFKNFKKFLK